MVATASDYLGRSFGVFKIIDQIGRGAEAEVLACQHLSTGLVYVLRLDVNEDELWEGAPLLPPRNATIERPNAHGTWIMEKQQYRSTLENLRKDPTAWKITSPAIYGVRDNRYLVPVASPIRVRGAWDVDRVLTTSPSDDLLYFELWEDVVLTMIHGAYETDQPKQAWQDRWRDLIGGQILVSVMRRYLDGGTLTPREKANVLRNVSVKQTKGPEFAENLLLRLCGCLSRGRMSLDEARATLKCIHFRRNVTAHDAQQMLTAASALRQNPLGSDNSLALLSFLFQALSLKPLDPYEEPDGFEIRDQEPDRDRYQLFLQEHAGLGKDVLTFKRAD